MTCIITLKISHLDKQISCLCRAMRVTIVDCQHDCTLELKVHSIKLNRSQQVQLLSELPVM